MTPVSSPTVHSAILFVALLVTLLDCLSSTTFLSTTCRTRVGCCLAHPGQELVLPYSSASDMCQFEMPVVKHRFQAAAVKLPWLYKCVC